MYGSIMRRGGPAGAYVAAPARPSRQRDLRASAHQQERPVGECALVRRWIGESPLAAGLGSRVDVTHLVLHERHEAVTHAATQRVETATRKPFQSGPSSCPVG